MVSRTRIPTSMYPSDYTPSTPSGVVTPASMTKDGSGEPILEEMIQDYPCGDEPGHGFRSSPLNIYALARDSSVVLYVEGGCPNFTWESDNEWATFETAETTTRYNTLTSSADEGGNVVITVTDVNGLESTISVPYMDASTCCEDPPALSIQTSQYEIGPFPGDTVVFLDGGCPPFTWEVTGTGITLDNATTNSRRNRVHGDDTAAEGTLSVEDSCGQTDSISFCVCNNQGTVTYDGDNSDETIGRNDEATIVVTSGCPPYTWAVAEEGFSFDDAETDGRENTLSSDGSVCGVATITVTDRCGDEATGYVRCTYGSWTEEVLCSDAGPNEFNCEYYDTPVIKYYIQWFACTVNCDYGGYCHEAALTYAVGCTDYPDCGDDGKRHKCVNRISKFTWGC